MISSVLPSWVMIGLTGVGVVKGEEKKVKGGGHSTNLRGSNHEPSSSAELTNLIIIFAFYKGSHAIQQTVNPVVLL